MKNPRPKKFEDYLVDTGVITQEQLYNTLESQKSASKKTSANPECLTASNIYELLSKKTKHMGLKQFKKLGDILIESGIITKEQLENALKLQMEKKQKIGRLVIELGYASEEQIYSALSKKLNIPVISCSDIIISEDIKKLLPKDMAEKNNVFPMAVNDGTLILAMADPLDYEAISDITFKTRLKVAPVISHDWAVKKAIENNYYDDEKYGFLASDIDVNKDIEFTEESEEESSINFEVLYSNSNAPTIVKLVATLIAEAVKLKASDLHIEPRHKYVQVRFRLDGDMQNILKYEKKMHDSVVSRIKIISKLDITNRRLPQDGGAHVSYNNKEVDLRISTLPSIHGEKIVIRLLDQSRGLLPLSEVGISEDIEQSLVDIFKRPQGMFLVTGPTGSGKTTTLYACLNQLRSDTRNVITIEDPVEYKLDGITQIQISEAVGRTFASVLRSSLRQDPDVIMVGEIRDQETAEIAVKGALTGHMVLSTLHTNNTIATITRLADIGIPNYLLSSALSGVVAQRLVRKLCNHCKFEVEIDETVKEFMETYGLAKITKQYTGKGCKLCRDTGYSGRIAVFEYLPLSSSLKKVISHNFEEHDLFTAAKNENFTLLFEDAWNKVRHGITSVDEVIAKIPMDFIGKA